jgi:tetratricopeptide (TPR) repeat protein
MPGNKLSKPAEGAKPVGKNLPKRQASWNDAEISPQNRDVLLQIASLIRLAESFRLGFVKCNQPFQSRQMAARLKEMLAGEANIITVELPVPVSSLRRAVLQVLESDKSDNVEKKAIMVFGFEHSVPSEGSAPALDELNQSRENFPKSFSGSVLIWLPDYALTRLAREAPDFWGWRSGVFELAPELFLVAAVEEMTMQGGAVENLSLSEKRESSAALDGLIKEYQELKRGEREDRAFVKVLDRLGGIRLSLGEYDEARKLFKTSLEISRMRGYKDGISVSLHQLAIVAQEVGNYKDAKELYRQSLIVKQELGDKRGVARSLHQLGILAQIMGDYDEARRFYLQSLAIKQELDDKRDISSSLFQLGRLAQESGNYKEALKLYQESLEINLDLGNKNGISKSLHQLGVLAQDVGNYDEAHKLYQRSLSIKRDTGDLNGISSSLHQLGNLAYLEGDYDEARKLYCQSLAIDQQLGDKSGIAVALAQSSLLDEAEGNLGKAFEHIMQAENLFLELGSPMVERVKNDRARIEKKLESSEKHQVVLS